MDSTDYKFFKVWNEVGLTPKGYRLATLEEVSRHSDIIMHPLDEKFGENDQKMCLLDGYITYPSDGRFDKEETFAECQWRALVQDSSASPSSEGDVLRKKLYDHVTLPPQGMEIAFLNATRHGDTDVIYWVLTTTSPEERQRLKDLMEKNKEFLSLANNPYYVHMVKRLVISEFSRLPLEKGGGNTVVDFAVEYAARSHENQIENTIAVAELLIEMYSPVIVDKEIFYTESNPSRTHPDTTEEEPECDIPTITVVTQFETNTLFSNLEIKNIENIMLIRDYEKSYLEKSARKAQKEEKCIPMLTKLLATLPSLSANDAVMIRPVFGKVFMEAITRGYGIVEEMLHLNEHIGEMRTGLLVQVLGKAISRNHIPYAQVMLRVWSTQVGSEQGELGGEADTDGKTLFHYAAEMGIADVFQLVNDSRIIEKKDKFGRSILHLASLHGHTEICKICIEKWQFKVEDTDNSGKNSLHFAVKGNNGLDVVNFLFSSPQIKPVHSQDYKGRTSLHLASEKGNIEIIKKLLTTMENDTTQKKKYIQETDFLSRTALHLASRQGDEKIVRLLLENGSDPLKERDIDGKTALHYAAQAKDENAARDICRLLLNKYEGSPEKKSLLLSAQAIGIGTADEGEGVPILVQDFFKKIKESTKDQNLLRLAAMHEDVGMVWELLDRGADIVNLHDKKWLKELRESQPTALQHVTNVIHQVEAMKGHGRDQPTMEDYLGREVFADGIAALFLNRFIESPITVGIIGEWGMGKSSVMIQTEKILLITAAKLAFPNIFPVEKGKSRKIELSKEGRKVYEKVKMGAKNLLQRRNPKNAKGRFGTKNSVPKESDTDKNPLDNMLKEYNPQDRDVYKSLACMDIDKMLDDKSQTTLSLAVSEIPRILTINYNAWHYRNEVEAWAGLAVTITKAIEASMTRSQRYSATWRYSWKRNRLNIWVQVFLPCFVAVVLGVFISVILLVFIGQGKYGKLKYGSIPLTIAVNALLIGKKVVSVFKPVSTQMMGYITSPSPGHISRLGYQEEVISDINFLKQEIGKEPHPFFSIITGDWHWFKLYPDNVETTNIPKLKPVTEDRLRIITFVDDLDRCEEKVILQVLSAINLVLAECKINVILGMDMQLITKAISNNYKNLEDRRLAEKFISKIVQIPLSLPDPTDEEFNNFLGHELGHKLRKAEFDGEDTDDGEQEPQTNKENENGSPREHVIVDIRQSPDQETRNPDTVYAGIKQVCRKFFNGARRFQFWKTQAEEKSFEVFSEGARLVRRTLLSNFSREEVDTIDKLQSFATGNRRFPREWKRFLNYYKLAFNILSRRGNVYSLSMWKHQLVAWIFVCWQWQQEMNILIKDWRKYAGKRSSNVQDGDNTNWDHWTGPSLKQVVTNCIQIETSQKSREIEESSTAENPGVVEQRRSLRRRNNAHVMELRGPSRQSSATLCLYENNEDSDEEATVLENCFKLQEALGIQDVSMKGIQLFQQFRFYCETDHLPWPLPQEMKKEI